MHPRTQIINSDPLKPKIPEIPPKKFQKPLDKTYPVGYTSTCRTRKPNKENKMKVPTAEERKAYAKYIGSIKSKKKAAASRRNGKLGGRPRKDGIHVTEDIKTLVQGIQSRLPEVFQ
jgi:hypothetical protein